MNYDINIWFEGTEWTATAYPTATKDGWLTTDTQTIAASIPLNWGDKFIDAPEWIESTDEWFMLDSLDMYDPFLATKIKEKLNVTATE